VDAHADPDRPGGERLLGRCRRAQRTGRGGKGDEEGIPLRVDLDAAVDAERGAQDAAVLRERLGVGFGAQLVQQLRRALDVGEDEGDGSGRELAERQRVCGKPRSTCDVAGSGQREVTTLPRV
jgi:hypothetical protein